MTKIGAETWLLNLSVQIRRRRRTLRRPHSNHKGNTKMNTTTSTLGIATWPIDRLVPYARNPRKNDAAVDRMCGSIREFGFKIPCLVRSDGEVIDGHLRLKAARKLGITDIPVILCDEWTPAQVKAFRLHGEPVGDLGRLGRGTAGAGVAGPQGARTSI